ncbi:MAG: hypothetical protein ACLR5S_05170 [Ruminococcus sp.]
MQQAQLARKTKETDIQVTVKLDNMGTANINTGIGFFDHMLTALSVHSGISMDIAVKVTSMWTVTIPSGHRHRPGKALGEALGDKSGITRYGSAFIPWTRRWHLQPGHQQPPVPGIPGDIHQRYDRTV